MASLRTWRTAAATLLLVALATTSTTAAASTWTPDHQRARYCKQVDAYRVKTCAKASSLTRRLAGSWAGSLPNSAGEAATLTEAEVRGHVSAEFLTVVIPPEGVIDLLRQYAAERGPSPSSASPTHPETARPWPWCRPRPASGESCRSASPTATQP